MKTCTIDGCDKKHVARGYCKTHYNKLIDTNRHPKKLTSCAYCGAEVWKQSGGGRKYGNVCSDQCRRMLGARSQEAKRLAAQQIVGPIKPSRIRPYPTWETERPSSKGVFVNGKCAWCGDTFTQICYGPLSKYCSKACSRGAHRSRHPEKKIGSSWIKREDRLAIYDRDGWVCQICGCTVDPSLSYRDNWSASLDHIIPRSHQIVPDHSAANLRLAHRMCNALRGDDGRHAALALAM